ncbi:MAG TPA: imidazole glycerol phosphate synthase subunit HisH [Thermomicrobiales bacterium]|nr:imidazole glycerol phosphate synthase subunit HisH [Thermomicrobiales bacterium]
MIAVVDYGAGNLRSIKRALEVDGAETVVTANSDTIRSADRVVLPGVGNAGAAMERLHDLGLVDVMKDVADAGTPLLGVCLGMQLLFGDQEEGPTVGLKLLQGNARKLPSDHKIPHMGWNTVAFAPHSSLAGLGEASFYFVHSYVVYPTDVTDIAGTTDYGVAFPSVVIRDNIWGTQFHPEKSGDSGLTLLKYWLAWNR